jgi:hypothetical protein
MSTHQDDQSAAGQGQDHPAYPPPPSPRPPAPYGQPTYGQPTYGQPTYGQTAYGQQYPTSYGQPGPAGYGAAYPQQPGYPTTVPSRPGGVITAAVLGFLFGAIGAIATVVAFVGSALLGSFFSSVSEGRTAGGVFTGVVVFLGVLFLAWTVVMIWGSVWALTGRSRVMLLIGGSIAAVISLFGLLGNAGSSTSSSGSVVTSIVFFAAAVAIVVLLSVRNAGAFYAAHRARRAGR